MGLKNWIAGIGIAAVSALSANAATFTTGEISSFLVAEDGVGIYSETFLGPLAGSAGTNPASLSLTATNSFNVNIGVANQTGKPGAIEGFAVSQVFTNDSGSTLVFDSETQNPAGIFTDLVYEVATLGGVIDLLSVSSFTVGANEQFTITVSSTDVTGFGNFDYVITAVPLPAGLALLLTALGGLVLVGRRRGTAAAAA